MSIDLEFEIKFESDFHIGAGHGLGLQVDSALLRDPDNVPVIRGTMLAGLLRESLRRLLQLKPLAKEQHCHASGAMNATAYCGQFGHSNLDCPICAVFGSPRRAKRWRISSARPVGLTEPQDLLNTNWLVGKTVAQTSTRVRINPRTRRAAENKLFTREEGDGSLRFRFTAKCLSNDATAWQEAEWLLAAARFTRHLGASKRRGRGECEIRLVDRELEKSILDRFEDRLYDRGPKIPAAGDAAVIQPLVLPAEPGQHSYRLRMHVRTDEPLLIARRAEAGNQFETLECIPGSVVRGALAWAVARKAGTELEDESSDTYQNFAKLFFRDAIRFSPLLPVQVSSRDRHQGYPTFPAPRDLLTCELHPGYAHNSGDRGHGVWSRTWEGAVPEKCSVCAESDDMREKRAVDTKLKTLGGFLPLNRAGLTANYKTRQTVEMHIRIQPQTGRVRTGDLFGYVSLEAGQYFAGEISCANKDVWEAVRQMAGLKPVGQMNELRFGRASRRGHGKVTLSLEEAEKLPWQGPSLEERVLDVSQVVMTLLSDAIVTDPWGRFLYGFQENWLKRELALPGDSIVEVEPTRCFDAVRPVDSFNAKLGLPRARDMALAAGSSVHLSFSAIGLAELQKLLTVAEAQGIGLRRDEGFGRVVFNHPIYQNLESWNEASLDLTGIGLGHEAREHDSTRRTDFEREWTARLDDQIRPQNFADGRFEAVARLLHVSQNHSRDAVRALLRKMGEQEELLPHPLPLRDKANFYRGEDGKQAMDKVDQLLGELEDLIEDQDVAEETARRLWSTGMQMLADRIAGPARRKAEEGR